MIIAFSRRRLLQWAGLVFLLVILAQAGLLLWPKVIEVFDGDRLIPIYSVERPDKKIAISFDATWGADHTPQILAILKKHNIKTTFFLVTMWMDTYPDMVKKIAAEGHEIQNHSTTHPDMTTLSAQQVKEELMGAHRKIKQLTGQDAFLFRPPFGAYNNTVITAAKEVGYYTIQWDVDSLDWLNEGADPVINRVLSQVRNGSIVLFHNNGDFTADALEPILCELEKRGFEIVPVSQLIYRDNYRIDHEGRQHQIKNL